MTSGGHHLASGPAPSGPVLPGPVLPGPVLPGPVLPGPVLPGPGGLRIGDAERAAVADRLACHFSHGRLDQAEFDDRLDRVMRAKTRADLAGLLTDLPETDQAQGRTAATSRRQRQAELELQRRRLRRERRDTRRVARAHHARGLTWVLLVAAVIVAIAWLAHTLTHSAAAWIVVLVIAVLWLRRGRIRD